MDKAFAQYVGDGDFINGVPARDMTAGEWAAVPEPLQRLAVALGVIEVDGWKAEELPFNETDNNETEEAEPEIEAWVPEEPDTEEAENEEAEAETVAVEEAAEEGD